MKRLLIKQMSKQNLIDEEPYSNSHKDSFIKILTSENRRSTFLPHLLPKNFNVKSKEKDDDTLDEASRNTNRLGKIKKEYYNRFSLERINFMFEEYREYPDEVFYPSIFFFKFLSVKPDFEGKKSQKLKLFIPDTIVYNDIDSNYWIYTDANGNVTRTEVFTDADILEKFRSPMNDETELLAVSKIPNYKENTLENNNSEILNNEELERYIYSKNSNSYALQRFVKCRGPKAFVCRTVWQRNKPAFVYILTNKANYNDKNVKNQSLKFVIDTKNTNSYSPFYATSGKHLEETLVYMKNIVKYIESHSDISFEELIDEAGIWWLINIKAFKLNNFNKFKNPSGENVAPNLEFFINRKKGSSHKTKKFDYQTKIKCKFCGIDYSSVKLKYSLTTKMIIETDRMLKHIGNNITFVDRPDLKHTDFSMIYLPFRVCEDCYLLFETMNDIKNCQIEIANFFRNPVDPVNFGLDYYAKKKDNVDLINLKEDNEINSIEKEKENKKNKIEDELQEDEGVSPDNKNLETKTKLEDSFISQGQVPIKIQNLHTNINNYKTKNENHLYRIMIIFTDLFWNETLQIPNKANDELYLLFFFLGNWYKIRMGKYYSDLDYFNINFFKIFYIVCDETTGFIEYCEKNRHMEIKLGYFENKKNEKNELNHKILNKDIIIEDLDICKNIDEFVEFASVELSLQGLKYGEKYRNSLNGLLFKKEKPHYVGKLRCVIRISKEGKDREDKYKEGKEYYKSFDITKYNLRKYFNFYIPPVNFVISDELQDYWLEIVERHKLRETILDSIFATMKKKSIHYDKSIHKEEIFKTLESLISYYLNKNQTTG